MNLKERIEKIVRIEILCCQTSLVDELWTEEAKRNISMGFNHEYVCNFYPIFKEGEEGTCEDCDEEDVILYADGEAICENCFDPDPQPILEWWKVSSWLVGKLRAEGEPILSNNYGEWWGRMCSGQSITLDGVIEDIAKSGSYIV